MGGGNGKVLMSIMLVSPGSVESLMRSHKNMGPLPSSEKYIARKWFGEGAESVLNSLYYLHKSLCVLVDYM